MKNDYQSKSQRQRDYYDSTAKNYDSWHVETASSKIVDQWNFSNLCNYIGNKRLNNCLDLACGTGRLTNNLLSIANNVYGLDISEKVLEIAKQKYPQLHLQLGEVTNLPYPDNFFDLVIINGALHHFFAMPETFKQVYRVLKSDGHFVLLGEPNKLFTKKYNPFFYLWLATRILAKAYHSIFIREKQLDSRLIEPEAEVFNPREMEKTLLNTGFRINNFYTYDLLPRNENRLYLKIYKQLLNLEHKTLAKIFKNSGQAIQVFAQK